MSDIFTQFQNTQTKKRVPAANSQSGSAKQSRETPKTQRQRQVDGHQTRESPRNGMGSASQIPEESFAASSSSRAKGMKRKEHDAENQGATQEVNIMDRIRAMQAPVKKARPDLQGASPLSPRSPNARAQVNNENVDASKKHHS